MGQLHPSRLERPELSEREFSHILLHTNFTRQQINESFVRFYTHFPTGQINFDEFSRLYSTELKHLQYSRPLLERLFHHIDTDKNGSLSFKELLYFKAMTMDETDPHEKLRWIFLLYDTNEDQQIDRSEFVDLCIFAHRIRDERLTFRRLNEFKRLFDQSDLDHDGYLNCDEFIDLCRKCNEILYLISPMFRTTKWNFEKTSKVIRKSKRTQVEKYFFQKEKTFSTDELTNERVEHLMKRTKFSREQIFSYYEQFHSRCKTNRLSQSEFVDFYQKILGTTTSETYCEFIFRAFDSISPDGFIQFDEFLLAIYIHSNASSPKEKLEWLFNAFDRDGNGSIDYEELNNIVHALFVLHGIDRQQHSVAYFTYEIMATLDLNNDDKISKQEFIYMLKDKELTSFLAPTLVKSTTNCMR